MKDIRTKWTVPVYWSIFSISYHAWNDPFKQITSFAKKENFNVITMIDQIVDYYHIHNYQVH